MRKGCKKFRDTGVCHCGLYAQTPDDYKQKIITLLIELKGQCPCVAKRSKDTYCNQWEDLT